MLGVAVCICHKALTNLAYAQTEPVSLYMVYLLMEMFYKTQNIQRDEIIRGDMESLCP